MLEILAKGVLLGLSAGLAPGPLLILVISETLQYGIKAGISVAFAPLLTDLPIILISLYVLYQLARFDAILGLISIFGAVFVFYIAYESLLVKDVEIKLKMNKPQSLRKGMLANILSPHPYLLWLSVGAPIMTKALKTNIASAGLFLLGFYCLLIGSKVVLAIMVGRSRPILTGKSYLYIMRFLGIALGVLAFILLLDGLKYLNFL